jgi:hypothetical protein
MGREIRGLFIHVPVAFVVGTCIGLALNAFLFGPIIGILRLHPNQLPNLGPFNPLLWSGSLLLGLLINYRTHRSASWVAGVRCLLPLGSVVFLGFWS